MCDPSTSIYGDLSKLHIFHLTEIQLSVTSLINLPPIFLTISLQSSYQSKHSIWEIFYSISAYSAISLITFTTDFFPNHLHNLPNSITIGNAQIPFKQSVMKLDFASYYHLTMNAHVSNIARTCYFELRRMASIRRFLTNTATSALVSVFDLSRIDYCNSLLLGSTHDVTSHLQRIQNYAAKVILRLQKSSNIAIQLKSRHWLPVKVTYKIACLCYHCHSSTA